MKSIKLSDYFKIIKPKYIYLKLIPNTSIRNYDTTNIIKSLTYMYKYINQKIYKQEKIWCYETSSKASYIIDITKNNISFYLVIPEFYKKVVEAKIREVWPSVTILEVEGIAPHPPSATKYQLCYRREDALSLYVNKKTNDPLNQMLSIIDILQDEKDRVTYYFNFIPRTQIGWIAEYNNTILKIKNHQSVEKYKNIISFLIGNCSELIIKIVDGIIESVAEILGNNNTKTINQNKQQISMLEVAYSTLNFDKVISENTKKKKNDLIINTQLIIISSSNNKKSQELIGLSAAQSFRSIEEDNELLIKPLKTNNINFTEYKISNAEINTMSLGECQNFLQLPGKELIETYKIENVNITETEVPIELKNGEIRVGINKYRGKEEVVTFTEHKELKNTAICIIGPNRSGKTTYIANFVHDNIKAGRSVILPDFCGKCELSDELNKVLPPDKIINVYCDDYNTLQGFGYNEIQPKSNHSFDKYVAAKMKAARLKELINTINDKDNDLEGRMERMMYASALVTFINKDTSIKDVFLMLRDHKYRRQLIDNIPEELKQEMEEYVNDLLEIDEVATKGENKGEVIGTKFAYISPILNRVHRLKENPYIEMMLQKSEKNNFNLIDYFNQGKLICLRMYDSMFSTSLEKDIYVCYWLTKVWGSLQMRLCNCDSKDKLNQVVILIDELYQVTNAENYLKNILSQMPKYRGKIVISAHHLDQIDNIQEELKSAMCSYLFLAGSNKKNFYSMKEEFEQLGFELEDLFNLKMYHALTLLSYEGGRWAGVVKLPPPIK